VVNSRPHSRRYQQFVLAICLSNSHIKIKVFELGSPVIQIRQGLKHGGDGGPEPRRRGRSMQRRSVRGTAAPAIYPLPFGPKYRHSWPRGCGGRSCGPPRLRLLTEHSPWPTRLPLTDLAAAGLLHAVQVRLQALHARPSSGAGRAGQSG
jgi:hypothetical protein